MADGGLPAAGESFTLQLRTPSSAAAAASAAMRKLPGSRLAAASGVTGMEVPVERREPGGGALPRWSEDRELGAPEEDAPDMGSLTGWQALAQEVCP